MRDKFEYFDAAGNMRLTPKHNRDIGQGDVSCGKMSQQSKK